MPYELLTREPATRVLARTTSVLSLSAALCAGLGAGLGAGLPAHAAEAAQVSAPSAPPPAAADPLEPLNRVLFRIHGVLDAVLLRPAAMTYARVAPRLLREGLHNAAVNLGEPRTAVNDALQGRGARAVKSLVRFSLNSTLGIAGLFDLAGRGGLPAQPNDFGITLARLGVRPGPYLFIPLVGPTTARDAVAGLADLGLNPLTYARYAGDTEVAVASVVSEGLEERAVADPDLKALEANATDFYASFRSFYLQNRAAAITGGAIDLKALPDFGDDPSPSGVQGPAPSGPGGAPPKEDRPPRPGSQAARLPRAALGAPPPEAETQEVAALKSAAPVGLGAARTRPLWSEPLSEPMWGPLWRPRSDVPPWSTPGPRTDLASDGRSALPFEGRGGAPAASAPPVRQEPTAEALDASVPPLRRAL